LGGKRRRKSQSSGKRSRKSASARAIRAGDLASYRGYAFAWFSEAAALLLANCTLEDLRNEGVGSVVPKLLQSLRAKMAARKGKAIDPKLVRPLPFAANDPKDQMTLEFALQTLQGLTEGQQPDSLSPPSALSLDFAEFTRRSMGRGQLKRGVFRLGEDVLALSLVGAYLTLAYRVQTEGGRWEYGYIFVNIRSPALAAVMLDGMQARVRGVTRRVVEGGGGFFPILVGAAAAIARTLGGQLKDVAKSPLLVEYLRLSAEIRLPGKPAKKVMAKGFDVFDVTGLAMLLRRGGIAGTVYWLVRSFPREGYNNYRGFVQSLSEGLAKYHMYKRPEHLYAPLRALCSQDLHAEAFELLGDRWQTFSQRLQIGLSRLAGG